MSDGDGVDVTYRVQGMTCEHCREAVTNELSHLPGVRSVDVDLDTGDVAVVSDAPLDPEAVRHAVDEAGFELTGEPGLGGASSS